MTNEGRFFDPDRVHERLDVGGEVVERVAAFGPLGLSVSVLVGHEGMVLRREQGEYPAEGEPRIAVPVEEDHRFTCWVALFGVVQPRTRREARRGEPKLRRD